MKRALYTRRLEQRGLTWSSISRTTSALASAQRLLNPLDSESLQAWESVSQCREGQRSTWLRLASKTKCPLGWEELEPFLMLRSELYETEIRFGQLGPEGLFTRLERAGVLSHSAPGVFDVARAVAEPPAMGRARIRGETIRELGAEGHLRCDWAAIWDLSGRRKLDLSDPFASAASWHTCSEREWDLVRGRFELLSAL
jgi:hypothetical protein